MELPAGTPVGVVGRTCMENLSRSIEGAGLDHLNVLQVYVDEEPEELLATLGRVRTVVCASVTARKLRELGIPEDLELIDVDGIRGHRVARQDATRTTPNCAGNRIDACLEGG